MGKNRKHYNETVEAKAVDNAGEVEPVQLKSEPVPSRITTEEEAISLVKSKYVVPDRCRCVLVTEDKNVFWHENTSSAVNHAQKNNLKLFRLKWPSAE